MILPIVGYGDPVLRKVGQDIAADYPNLSELIANMYETMYNAYGVGLAAPQIGLAIRLFIVDTEPFSESEGLKRLLLMLKFFKKKATNGVLTKVV
jgi:peptide deformylase